MVNSVHTLAAEFLNSEALEDTPSAAEVWENLVAKTLNGSDFSSLLVKHSEDNIPLGPLFTTRPKPQNLSMAPPHLPKLAERPWHIAAFIHHPNIAHANTDILADLSGGVSALSLQIDPNGAQGIAVQSASDIQRLLSGVLPELVPITLTPCQSHFEYAALFAAHFQTRKNIHLNLGYTYTVGDEHKLLSLSGWAVTHAPHWKAISINGATAHEMGASPAQELAYMLSHAVAVIKLLKQDHSIDAIFSLLDVHLASDQDTHQGIIKFRASRILWAKIAQEFGASPSQGALSLHVKSSERMLATQDPWANLLRLNSACFSAVCGGANYITVLPFTHPLGLATPFARRIARNMQILQMEETHLGHVHDPASGSYMHENLTGSLAQKAWEIFQHMEGLGGWAQAKNWLFSEIKSMDDTRNQHIQDGEILRVGVNQFVKPDVRKAEILPRPTIKPKSGSIIQTDDFEDAIRQALSGHIVPMSVS